MSSKETETLNTTNPQISAGLVIIQDNKILLGHPTGQKWQGTYSIPKGHLETNETSLETAIRETKEEVGIDLKPNDFDIIDSGTINYASAKGVIYKKVRYFTIYVKHRIEIDKKKLQKEEIDWAGFLDKKEAEKRIFWRQKEILKYLK